MRLVLETLTVPPFDENTYLVGDAEAGEAVVVDPGGRADEVIGAAERRGVRIIACLGTHTHIDHVTGVLALQALVDAPFFVHPEAEAMLRSLPQQAAMFGLPPVAVPGVAGYLQPGTTVRIGALSLEVRHAPGHAPGHVVLVGPEVELDGRARRFALVGDVVFLGSIGRTDLPGGDYETLMRSIEREVMTLPDDTVLYSGHGPATTVGHERAYNPFVRDWLARGGRNA